MLKFEKKVEKAFKGVTKVEPLPNGLYLVTTSRGTTFHIDKDLDMELDVSKTWKELNVDETKYFLKTFKFKTLDQAKKGWEKYRKNKTILYHRLWLVEKKANRKKAYYLWHYSNKEFIKEEISGLKYKGKLTFEIGVGNLVKEEAEKFYLEDIKLQTEYLVLKKKPQSKIFLVESSQKNGKGPLLITVKCYG